MLKAMEELKLKLKIAEQGMNYAITPEYYNLALRKYNNILEQMAIVKREAKLNNEKGAISVECIRQENDMYNLRSFIDIGR
jgi:hypothetical protein